MVYPHAYRTEHSETLTTSGDYGDYFREAAAKKIKIQPPLLKLLRYVDSNRAEFTENLREVIAIKTISSELRYRDQIMKMAKVVERWMVRLGMVYECFSIGFYETEGRKVRLPPVILATAKAGSNKKTVCLYAHLDVKKPVMEHWDSDPWDLLELNKVFYGNGVVVGKGALMCWLHALLAFKEAGVELPVNVKLIIECMHYKRSHGLKEFLIAQRQIFLVHVDYIVVCDSEWLTEKYPCVTYGCVGMLHFTMTITKTSKSKTEPKEDMVKIFEKIADGDNIIIPDFNKSVSQVTPDEEALFESIVFDMEGLRKSLPPDRKKWSKSRFLMQFWRKCTIYVDDIQVCICDKKDTTKVKRHFITKLVPHQNAENCIKLTEKFVELQGKGMENTVELESHFETRPWLENCASPNYEAARRATIQIYKEDPSMIQLDRDMKCVNILQVIEKSILLLPLGAKGGNGGKDNENIPLRNFFEGTKLVAAYLFQIAMQP